MLFIVFTIIFSVLICLCACGVSGNYFKVENNRELSNLSKLILLRKLDN